MCEFHAGKMKVRKLSAYTGKEDFLNNLIEGINTIRGHYKWSQKNYDNSNIDNVYIVACNGKSFAFIECEICEQSFCNNKKLKIFIHELHVAPSMQRKGVGIAIINHLLSKGVDLEMVVVKENENMFKLLSKFNYEEKYITENTKTIIVKNS